jgi:polysaccharide export outer membrane protein
MRVLLAVLAFCAAWATAAVAQELQAGDTIAISVYQDPKLDRQVVIGPTGLISFPLAGRVKAAGLTPQDLEKALRAKLRDKYAGTLDITVALVAATKPDDEQKPRFYITGEVNKPGPYMWRSSTTLVQAIAMSGGLGQFAARHRIQVRRRVDGNESTFLFDYGAYEAGKDGGGNIELQPGDVIIVPQKSFWE